MSEDTFELYAIRYAQLPSRTRRESFLGLDDHDSSPNPLDFFIWLIRNDQHTIVVDTGFDTEESATRNRKLDRLPREGLAALGIDTNQVKQVIITHLHWDHAGTFDDFPNAQFHLQESEMAYATGRCMCYDALRHPYSVKHVCQMVENVYSGRVIYHEGSSEVVPGVVVHHIGGHAKGLQCVQVKTNKGWMVLASDASHYYENFEQYRPFIITHDVEATLRGYDKLRKLVGGKVSNIVPGHDPQVMSRFDSKDPRFNDFAVRLDGAS